MYVCIYEKMVGGGSSFCLKGNRPHVRVRSPATLHSKVDDLAPMTSGGGTGEVIDKREAAPAAVSRKIMIVVDPSIEAKVALQWTLTHAVQPGDVILLLFVDKKDKPSTKLPHFLTSMSNSCQLKKPQVQVETVVIREKKEKGARIVEEARKQGVAMLVLGQKRTLMMWRLLMSWVAAGRKRSIGSGVVEYCIQNTTCMAVAVRRKSKKLGGYLITTKRQKDFWLLA